MPTRQLTSTDWVIEAGIPNTSWDLVTTNGDTDTDTEEDTSVPDAIDSMPTHTVLPNTVSKPEVPPA